MSRVRHVVLYTSADDVATRAVPVMAAHTEHYRRFAAAGLLLGVGTFGDPQAEGAMCVLVSREAAEEFARTDPFVVQGVVRSYRILEWTDVLAD
ncbi:YciI family protein [Cellulomonas massiliensis]|uniref:YciI family protein n=1 Tax=Cellulomonas massiliensis TaxID=1465811 RepID=UPI0003138331|nr:YciI family protein [Cellulomonas massiliensis]